MAKAEAQRPDAIDAVIITTPNNIHFSGAKVFLQAGYDIICDKPSTNTLEEALGLSQAVEKSNCVFVVSYLMSCFPTIWQAREIVASAKSGRINQIHVELIQDWMTLKNAVYAPHVQWRLDPKVSGPTSCVGDFGTHAAHLAQFVSGARLHSERADFNVWEKPKTLEGNVFMMTNYDGEILGTLNAMRQAPGNRGGLRLRIFASLGGLEWDMEAAEQLKLNMFGQPYQIISRGNGHGMSKYPERFVRTGRAFLKD